MSPIPQWCSYRFIAPTQARDHQEYKEAWESSHWKTWQEGICGRVGSEEKIQREFSEHVSSQEPKEQDF